MFALEFEGSALWFFREFLAELQDFRSEQFSLDWDRRRVPRWEGF